MSVQSEAESASLVLLMDEEPLAMDEHAIAEDFRWHFRHTLGRDQQSAPPYYQYYALALVLRDRLMERWRNTRRTAEAQGARRAYYLSLEFLMGRALGNAMLNLGGDDAAARALGRMGLELENVVDEENDPGLGNGGLGRLAACFLDSCATLQLPVTGYGIRYEYGMFRQRIVRGEQVEEPDHWLRSGNPWELERPEFTRRIKFGGRSEHVRDETGRHRARWLDTQDVLAVPYDVPVPGYQNNTVNTLRLWKAMASNEFNLGEFNAGQYPESVAAKNAAENITMVLYPNDASENGKELRLRQQYFLASASLQDVLSHWVAERGPDFTGFADHACFQLNDTHPTCAVPELMRLLMDDHGLSWTAAWDVTRRTMAYTNHTLLPEALEQWPVHIFRRLLPRVLEIIFEINARFLAEVAARWPHEPERLRRMSIITDGDQPQVRMAFLAIVGSFSVNGVAELHSQLLKRGLFKDFNDLWPAKFNNKTNGVTQRRWLAWCNPELSALLDERIGKTWISDLGRLEELAHCADDRDFQSRWQAVKRSNKKRLSAFVERECGLAFDPDAMFDVQVKRIHEYKRQLLNVLHVIHLYDRILRGDTQDWTPRCVLIGGKAAPGYFLAKRIIKLISNVADVVNAASAAKGRLSVAFLPNYCVSAMELICPGADLSEQISTAGKEASGTGNMKLMMNGAITIGTLDGANIEIRDAVGDDNFLLFGLTAEQVEQVRVDYDPAAIINVDEDLSRVMRLLEHGHFNAAEPGIFDPIVHSLKNPRDPWLVAADFRSYVDAQQRASELYRNPQVWSRMSILNVARSGRFSTDRTIEEYNNDIWKLSKMNL